VAGHVENGMTTNERSSDTTSSSDDVAIRTLAARLAQEHDTHVDRVEDAIRNLIESGLIDIEKVRQ
jgi:hypothetical protein